MTRHDRQPTPGQEPLDGLDLPDCPPPHTEPGVDQEWAARVTSVIEALADTGMPFTAYQVAQVAGEPRHFRHWGRAVAAAHARGLIVPVGATPSRRPSTHRSLVHLWRGADRRPDPGQT